jgi:Sec-independent protein translocase protein TatA
MLNLPEIVIILITVAIIFGLGKLGDIGQLVVRMRLRGRRALTSGTVDITPSNARAKVDALEGPRPGARAPSIEDAQIEAPPKGPQPNEE